MTDKMHDFRGAIELVRESLEMLYDRPLKEDLDDLNNRVDDLNDLFYEVADEIAEYEAEQEYINQECERMRERNAGII